MPDLSRRDWISLTLVGIFIAGWVALFALMSPDGLVERLGIQNAYLVVFALGVLGAMGSMTTVSTYPALVAFVDGGMSVLGLTVVAGLGLTLGDLVFYGFAGEVKGLLRGRLEERARRLGDWLDERPGWVIPVVTWAWVGLLPLANNILTGALALLGVPARRIVVPLLLGNLTFPLGVAWLARRGIDLFG